MGSARTPEGGPGRTEALSDDAASARDPAFDPAIGCDALVLPSRYLDVRLIGSGAFGEVRRVHDHELGRSVAMKIVRRDVTERARVRARFAAEIAITAALQHPGIVAVYDAGELDDGRMWFTMPEIRGRTLGAVIAERVAAARRAGGPEPRVVQRRLVDLFARACEAVAHAHRRGVIHRDLKPENIMVGAHGQVVVMDWGLARRLGGHAATDASAPQPLASPVETRPMDWMGGDAGVDETVDVAGARADAAAVDATAQSGMAPALTGHGDVLGTPAYMSPEQARGELADLGPTTDVHALGAILYHLLAGAPPFAGMTPRAAWRAVQSSAPVPVAEAAPPGFVIPAELATLCSRAMAHAPQARFADAGELTTELAAWLDGARRRERALAGLAATSPLQDQAAALRERATGLRRRARVLLGDVRPFEPVAAKRPAWALEDEAAALERRAALCEARWLEGVHGVLAAPHEWSRSLQGNRLPRANDFVRAYVTPYLTRTISSVRT